MDLPRHCFNDQKATSPIIEYSHDFTPKRQCDSANSVKRVLNWSSSSKTVNINVNNNVMKFP